MKNFILTLLLVCLMATNATAAVTSVFNQKAIPGGLGLDNYVSNTWDITTDYKWLSALLYVDLTATGNIYQDGSGTNSCHSQKTRMRGTRCARKWSESSREMA